MLILFLKHLCYLHENCFLPMLSEKICPLRIYQNVIYISQIPAYFCFVPNDSYIEPRKFTQYPQPLVFFICHNFNDLLFLSSPGLNWAISDNDVGCSFLIFQVSLIFPAAVLLIEGTGYFAILKLALVICLYQLNKDDIYISMNVS